MSMPTSWSRVLTTFCALLLLTTGAYAAKSGTIDFASLSPADAVPGELLVKYRPTITTSSHASVHTAAAVGGKAKYSFRTIPWQVVKIPDNVALQAAADAYRSDPRVMLVEPNYIVHAIETVPNDPNYGDLWGMARIDAPFAWDISTGNSDIVVAVIDTGIRYTHEDLADNMWTNPGEIAGNGIDDDGNGYVDDVRGWDFVNNDNDPFDDQGHGTHCAGTIGAVGDNGIGVVGVNWNVKMVAVKFLGLSGGTTADAIKSVEYVSTLSDYVRLSNNSWGGGGFSMALEDAIRESGLKNQLFLAAAGNSSVDNDVTPHYPSSYDLDNIIAVASIASGGSLSSFSCYGKQSVDIGAPGSDIYSTEYDSDSAYGSKSGTSMACPHVAGAAALVWGQNLLATYGEVRDAILDTAQPNPALTGKVVTDGELNVAEAIGQIGGALTLDQLAYRSDAAVLISVADVTVLDPTNTVEVSWRTTSNGILRTEGDLLLYRIPGLPSFTNSLQLTSGVTAVHGDMLRVSYDLTATTNTVLVTAPIDDLPPVISNVRSIPFDATTQVIQWDTDESANAYAVTSLTVPPDTNVWEGTAGYADWGSGLSLFPHDVTVPDLTERSIYHYAVRSADPAGNTSVYPVDLLSSNSMNYPRFATRYLREVYSETFESGELEWTHGGLDDCWKYGVPEFGPSAAFSGSNCWGTCLDGYYPNLMNAWLVSPPIEVGEGARLSFMSWHEIEEGFDNGYVEVNWGSGWHTVITLTGASLGEWVPLTVVLPEASANEIIQIRFRLQSDYVVRQAGWYVDDVIVEMTSEAGIHVLEWVNPVDDRTAYDPDNDADGYPEIGETFDLNFRMFNSQTQDFVNVISRVDCPTDGITIDPAHDTISYGSVAFGDALAGAVGVRVSVTNAPLEPMTHVPFMHTITADGGYVWEDIITLDLTPHETVSGVVTNLGGTPIKDATVHGSAAGYPDVQAETAADGAYVLNGMVSGVGYDVYAAKPGDYGISPSVTVTGPAANVNFALGRAFADPSPSPLTFVVEQTGTDDATLTIANTNALADQHIDVSLTGTVVSANIAISFPGAPDPLTVAPGTSETVTVRVAASGAGTGDYEGAVLLVGNAVTGSEVEVPVEIEVQPGPVLNLLGTITDDSLSGDGDGFIDPGETIEPGLVVDNSMGGADANSVTGLLSFVGSTGVTAVTDGDLDFGTIPVDFFWFDFGEFVVDPAAPDGLELPFELELWDSVGHYWMFPFSMTVEDRSSIRGTITDAVTTLPVDGVTVTAVNAMQSGADVSIADGTYGIHGVASGVYTVSVASVAGYANPLSQVCIVSNADCTVDFALPAMDISWDPESFAVTVPEGREAVDALAISNGSVAAVEVRLRGSMEEGALISPEMELPDATALDWAALTEEDAHLDRLIVRFNEGLDVAAMDNSVAAVGGKILRRLKHIAGALVVIPPHQSLAGAALTLAADSGVAYVEPNYRYKINAAPGTPRREPNDSFYSYGRLYGLDNYAQDDGTADADIDAPECWHHTTGDTNLIVAVLDTGIDWEHTDLAANLWTNPGETGLDTNGVGKATNNVDDDANGYIDDLYGWNFLYSTNGGAYAEIYTDGLPIDDHGHGTHVSGTIGAVGDNGSGVVGVNWHTRIMALKIADMFGAVDAFAAAEALEYAVDNGAKFSNNSWGGSQFSYIFHEMVAHARTNDQLVICAAGNDGLDNDAYASYPASDPSDNIIAVAASDRDAILADFSNWGEDSVDLAAPGVGIVSTYPGDAYAAMDGTSMATPHVVGVAALLKAFAPTAPWNLIKEAIMEGAVHDVRLEGMMRAEGHCNAYNALRLLSAQWMAFNPTVAIVPAGGDTNVAVTFNVGGLLPPGHYEADIVLESGGADTNRIPVSLDVSYAPLPRYVAVRVDDTSAGDGDGYAEPGEQVDLYVTVRNAGSLTLGASSGSLASTTVSVTVDSPGMAWPTLESGDAGEVTAAATVTFGAGVASNVLFSFDLDDGVNPPWTGLQFDLGVWTRHSLTGAVREASTLNGISGATVEFYGTAGGDVQSAAGGAYAVHGLADGDYMFRGRGTGYGRTDWEPVTVTGADVTRDFLLGEAVGDANPTNLTFSLLSGQTNTLPVGLTNSGLSGWTGTVYEIARPRVVVISDGARLTDLEALLHEMGLDVSGLDDNAVEYYTALEGTLSEYDLVIADVGGPNGYGRKFISAEGYAIDQYVNRGGHVILAGRNLLGRPDSQSLRELAGSSTGGIQRVRSSEAVVPAGADEPALTGPYADFSVGDHLEVTSNFYDVAWADTNEQASALLRVGGSDKVMRRRIGAGTVTLWGGHHAGAEWTTPGPLRELFRNLVLELVADDVTWLIPQAAAFDLGVGGASNLDVQVVSPLSPSEVGTNAAALLLIGNLPDQPDRAVRIELITGPVAVRVMSTTGVERWDGTRLEGNSGPSSALYQLISVGADGTNNVADTDGGTTGDDVLLATLDVGALYGRFGDGYAHLPDLGMFTRQFGHELASGAPVYVRAWDSSTFAGAVAYGDSSLYLLQRVADEEHDFGTWVVGTSIDFPASSLAGLRDQDGDSIPDGWAMQFGLDPRNPIGPLAPTVTVLAEATGFDKPGRVVAWSNFVFVADTEHNRITVLSRDLATELSSFGSYGTGNGQFDSPQGLALFGSAQKLIVADTDNFRVQILDVDPVSGALSYATQFGGQGAGAGQFDHPYAVDVSQVSGRIYVADSYNSGMANHRIQRFSSAGAWELSFGVLGSDPGELNQPLGVTLDSSGLLYVAEEENHRVQCLTATGVPLWETGVRGSGTNEFDEPRDVSVGMLSRLYVADTSNHRIGVYRIDGAPGTIIPVGHFGSFGHEDGEFAFPQGVFAMADSPDIYVADTVNGRVQLLRLTMDNDGDGMEDMWEDVNGLDSTDSDDWDDDPDGDGLLNIGEYRIGTDPQNGDSNGNGGSDGLEVALGRDPLADPAWDLLIIRDLAIDPSSVGFNVESGGVYQVETRTNLLSGTWDDLGAPVTGATDGVLSVTVPTVSDPERFYRIRKTN